MGFSRLGFCLATLFIPYLALCNAKIVPELKFHPTSPSPNAPSLIWFKAHEPKTVAVMTEDIDRLLEVYKRPGLTPGRGQNIINCDYARRPRENEVCNVDVGNWSPCTHENNYGYFNQTPCIFLKLDKMFGWEPEYYNDTDALPATMSEDLKVHIGEQKKISQLYGNQLWVSCSGNSPVDNENIGPVKYFPGPGFPGYFFPYANTEGNLSPLVAVQFKRPQLGIIIDIKCKLWARNLNSTQPEKQGVVNIELLVD